MRYYLGIDGGQSHTTALVAEESGRIVGRGAAGPSNHTRAPGGRERLVSAVVDSVGGALRAAGLGGPGMRGFPFFSAHLALTGESAGKLEIVRELLSTVHLDVGHDAPAALAGAMGGGDGVIVLSGTGSVAYGSFAGRTARVGGVGYVFGDEGSGFDIARRSMRRALQAADRGEPDVEVEDALLRHFGRPELMAIVEGFYAEAISREELAAFSRRAAGLAESGEAWAAEILEEAALHLARMAQTAAARLAPQTALHVSYGGGVFGSRLVLERFRAHVCAASALAGVVEPRFGPDVGALILAFRSAGSALTEDTLQAMAASAAARP